MLQGQHFIYSFMTFGLHEYFFKSISAHTLSIKFGIQQDQQKQYLGIAIFTVQPET